MDTRPPGNNLGVSFDFDWTLPADMVAVVLFVVVSGVLLVTIPVEMAPLRAVFALPVLLFVPGYVLLAAIYPHRDASERAASSEPSEPSADPSGTSAASTGPGRAFGGRSISWTERVALSFGISVALIPLFGLVIAPIAGAMTLEPLVLGVSVFVLAGAAVAIVRRNHLPKEQRFRIRFGRWVRVLRSAVFGRRSRIDSVLVVLLLVSVLAAVSTMGFALLHPQEGESYTSVTLLTENADGEFVAEGYPTEFEQGIGEELVLRVDNHERAERTYTFVVELQRVDASGDSMSVIEDEVITREQETVAAGDTWLASHTVAPTMTGENLRMAYYLYAGEPPADPNEENAYRHLYLWIDVSDSSAND